ncbi:MAG: hypothetical protein AB1711_09510 [Thermodesulfobacteriota bacterium]
MKQSMGYPDSKRHALAILLISISGLLVYSNSLDCSFHFDDIRAIVENYAIHRVDLREIFATSSRPILDVTLAINYALGGLNVFGYHLVNLALHIANGIMIYFILSWTANLPSVRDIYQGQAYRIALYASLLFMVHPIQTQAVTYIISRSEVLASSFYLLTLLLIIKAFQVKKKGPYLTGALISSCLGMGTKQIVATLPLALVIYDFYFLSDGDWKILKSHYKIHLAMFSTLVIVLFLNILNLEKFISFDYTKGVPVPLDEPVTSFQYFLTQLHVIPYYIRLLFLPVGLNLDYDWPIVRSVDGLTVLFFLFLVALIIIGIAMFRRSRLFSFSIIWFFVTLSVTSSFIVIYDPIFEHRLYLPSVGFVTIIALLISRISGPKIKA